LKPIVPIVKPLIPIIKPLIFPDDKKKKGGMINPFYKKLNNPTPDEIRQIVEANKIVNDTKDERMQHEVAGNRQGTAVNLERRGYVTSAISGSGFVRSIVSKKKLLGKGFKQI
jgi:hypothetical protein